LIPNWCNELLTERRQPALRRRSHYGIFEENNSSEEKRRLKWKKKQTEISHCKLKTWWWGAVYSCSGCLDCRLLGPGVGPRPEEPMSSDLWVHHGFLPEWQRPSFSLHIDITYCKFISRLIACKVNRGLLVIREFMLE
jgi:hypothetical protein